MSTKADAADRRHQHDEARPEPVVLEPPIERDFERAEETGDQQEADHVEPGRAGPSFGLGSTGRTATIAAIVARPTGKLIKKHQRHETLSGEPAAERRADDRCDHDGDPEQREGLAAFFRRDRVGENRLRDRQDAAPARPAGSGTEKRIRDCPPAAQHRTRGESPRHPRKKGFRRAAGHKGLAVGTRRWRPDRSSPPRRLRRAHPHTARDILQGHVGDVVSSTSMKAASATRKASAKGIAAALAADAPPPPSGAH